MSPENREPPGFAWLRVMTMIVAGATGTATDSYMLRGLDPQPTVRMLAGGLAAGASGALLFLLCGKLGVAPRSPSTWWPAGLVLGIAVYGGMRLERLFVSFYPEWAFVPVLMLAVLVIGFACAIKKCRNR